VGRAALPLFFGPFAPPTQAFLFEIPPKKELLNTQGVVLSSSPVLLLDRVFSSHGPGSPRNIRPLSFQGFSFSISVLFSVTCPFFFFLLGLLGGRLFLRQENVCFPCRRVVSLLARVFRFSSGISLFLNDKSFQADFFKGLLVPFFPTKTFVPSPLY